MPAAHRAHRTARCSLGARLKQVGLRGVDQHDGDVERDVHRRRGRRCVPHSRHQRVHLTQASVERRHARPVRACTGAGGQRARAARCLPLPLAGTAVACRGSSAARPVPALRNPVRRASKPGPPLDPAPWARATGPSAGPSGPSPAPATSRAALSRETGAATPRSPCTGGAAQFRQLTAHPVWGKTSPPV